MSSSPGLRKTLVLLENHREVGFISHSPFIFIPIHKNTNTRKETPQGQGFNLVHQYLSPALRVLSGSQVIQKEQIIPRPMLEQSQSSPLRNPASPLFCFLNELTQGLFALILPPEDKERFTKATISSGSTHYFQSAVFLG